MKVNTTQGKQEPALTRVHFPVPIVGKIEPVRPVTQMTYSSVGKTQSEAREICEKCIKEGFNEGAIVVRRTVQTLSMATSPHAWGVVVYVNKYAPYDGQWKPLRVRWLSGSAEPSILYDMEELILIHPSHSPKDLEDFINCQNPPWQK